MYRALARMVDQGMIQAAQSRPDPEPANERRNYYRITHSDLRSRRPRPSVWKY